MKATLTVLASYNPKIKGEGIDQLLENVLAVADLQDLRANPKRKAVGVVLEASTDRHRGVVATVLVQTGTLHVGDNFIAGPVVGKVRALIDDRRGRPADDLLSAQDEAVRQIASSVKAALARGLEVDLDEQRNIVEDRRDGGGQRDLPGRDHAPARGGRSINLADEGAAPSEPL